MGPANSAVERSEDDVMQLDGKVPLAANRFFGSRISVGFSVVGFCVEFRALILQGHYNSTCRVIIL